LVYLYIHCNILHGLYNVKLINVLLKIWEDLEINGQV
jgi:hypothetical protein